MMYQSIADIYNFNDEVRRRLVSRVESLSDAQHASRADAEEAWSIAHIVEHLSMIEPRMVGLLGMLLKQSEKAHATTSAAGADGTSESTNDVAEADGAASSTGAGAYPFKPFSFDLRPPGEASAADSLAKLEASRVALRELRPRLEAADLEAATYPHPVFGPLNIAQWLAFIGLHEGRHLRQIERLLAPPGTETQTET